MRDMVCEALSDVQQLTATTRIECENLRLKADQLESINTNFRKDKEEIYHAVDQTILKSNELVFKMDRIVADGNTKL